MVKMDVRKSRLHTKFNGKIYAFSTDFKTKSEATKWAKHLRTKNFNSRVAKLDEDTSKFPPDVLKAYKKDFPHGRWGVWARGRNAKY